VRRATVTVQWGEGEARQSFDVVQYVVANQGAYLPGQEGEEDTPTDDDDPTGGGQR
jgi:hypothetical protein